MEGVIGRLTVYFEDPFWVGVFERESGGCLEVCRVVFGPEPAETELHEFLLSRWNQLCFSKAIESPITPEKRLSPKRMQKLARKETQQGGIGTKARQAIKRQMEADKSENKEQNRFFREEHEERMRLLKQQKKKEKHRGH